MQPPFDLFDRSVGVSASIGIVTSPPFCTWEEVLHAADSAMYEAKAAGRDRFVISASDPDVEPSTAEHDRDRESRLVVDPAGANIAGAPS